MDVHRASSRRLSSRPDPGHPLSPAHLRNEIEADIFATGVLLQATLSILAEMGRDEPFDPLVYIDEVYTYLNVIALVQRCRAVVRWASDGQVDRSDVALGLLEPVAILVRMAFVREYLSSALALYFARGNVANANVDGWREVIGGEMSKFETETHELDSGLGEATRLILWDTEPLGSLLAAAATELGQDPMFKLEARSLFARSQSLVLNSETLTELARLAS